MNFEDYNYAMYNKYILIDPNKTPLDSDLDPEMLSSENENDSNDSQQKIGWSVPKNQTKFFTE